MEAPLVQLRPGSIWINGRPVILFSSSLFYFRLPAAEWRGRMRALARLGYNAIDVYFPWNYHELRPGVWDFTGERDVAAFLRMAVEEGLWVIARPGPYICSEWDGGALPAFLSADPGMTLRDAGPAYLQAARAWYDRIMPLIAAAQLGRGGSVVLVQIENELDFYATRDRAGMLSALRDMALEHGVTVPLIACAGQGDLPGATGGVDGLLPTCNVYFDHRDPLIEERVRHYARLLAGQGLPLCVVETNRSHTDLRRLIAAGAKLVGPYLQAGGTDFGFTTGVTNWGSPLAFMTSYYDFHGMLSPAGIARPECIEARLLTRLLETLGPAAALAAPLDAPPVPVDGPVSASALALDGGGWLLALANPAETPAPVTLSPGPRAFPRRVPLSVEPHTCPFLLYDFPLSTWGVDGAITASTAELAQRADLPDGLDLLFVHAGPLEITLRLPGAALGEHTGWQVEQAGADFRLWAAGAPPAGCMVQLPGARRLVIRAADRETAAGVSLAELNPLRRAVSASDLAWSAEVLDPTAPSWLDGAQPCPPGRLLLEQNGVYRGYAWYRAALPAGPFLGLLARSAADVLSLYAGENYLATLVPGGLDAFVPLPPAVDGSTAQPLILRAEIWGHANFDDNRLPALRLKSMRGLAGLDAVSAVTNLTPNWFYQDGADTPAAETDPRWPQLYFGGWSTTREPAPGIYYREIAFAPAADTRVLHLPGLQVPARVYVGDRLAGEVGPFSPFLDLSSFTRPGQPARLAVAVDQRQRRELGMIHLYEGRSIQDWQLAAWDEERLAALAVQPAGEPQPAGLPFHLAPGQMAWLRARIPLDRLDPSDAWDLVFEGQELKITVFLGRRIVGRLWLPSAARPRMAGGRDDRAYLPAAWLREAAGQVTFLLEATGPAELARAGLALDE